MTAIVGLEHHGAVWMAGDTRAEGGSSGRLVSQPKIWRAGEYLLGAAGSIRAADIVRHGVELPPAPARGAHKHVVTIIVPAIRRALRAAGYRLRRDEAEGGGEDAGADLLIGFRGHLFAIDGEFQVQRNPHGFEVIGSGELPALGAMYATAKLAPRARLTLALEAAELYGVGVRRPWTIKVLPAFGGPIRRKQC